MGDDPTRPQAMAMAPAPAPAPAPTAADGLHAKWVEWINAMLGDFYLLQNNRQMWEGLVKVVQANPSIPEPHHLMNWIKSLYMPVLAMAIRRLADQGRGAISLFRLLKDLQRNPGVMTRERYRTFYRQPLDGPASDQDFDDFADPGYPDRVSPSLLRADVKKLVEVSRAAKHVVDAHIAHHLEVPSQMDVTYDELHAALEEMDILMRRYYRLLTGGVLIHTTPVQQFDWKESLSVPWAPERA